MARIGTLTLQAMDDSDIFLKEDVYLDGLTDFGEAQCSIVPGEPGFEAGKAWETGSVPKMIPVLVEGDSSIILGWFKSDGFFPSYFLKVYIEYEEVEEMVSEPKVER